MGSNRSCHHRRLPTSPADADAAAAHRTRKMLTLRQRRHRSWEGTRNRLGRGCRRQKRNRPYHRKSGRVGDSRSSTTMWVSLFLLPLLRVDELDELDELTCAPSRSLCSGAASPSPSSIATSSSRVPTPTAPSPTSLIRREARSSFPGSDGLSFVRYPPSRGRTQSRMSGGSSLG